MIRIILGVFLCISTILNGQYSNFLDKEFAEEGRLNLEIIDPTFQIYDLLVRVDDENNIFICSRQFGEIAIYKFNDKGESVLEFGVQGKLSFAYDGTASPIRHYEIINDLHFLIPPNESSACMFSFNSDGEIQENLNSAITNSSITSPRIYRFKATDNFLYKLIGRDYSNITNNYIIDILRYKLDGELDESFAFEINQFENGEPIISNFPQFAISEENEVYIQIATKLDTTINSGIIKVSSTGKIDSTFANNGYFTLSDNIKYGNELDLNNNVLYYTSSNIHIGEYNLTSFEISSDSLEIRDSRIFNVGDDSQYRNIKFHSFDETLFFFEERFSVSWEPTYSVISFDENLNEFSYYGDSYRLILGEGIPNYISDITIDNSGRHYLLLRDEGLSQLVRLNNTTINSVQNVNSNLPFVYPTNIESTLTIELYNNIDNSFELYNSQGILVAYGKLNEQKNIIPFPNLIQGTYYLVLKNVEGEVISYKLYKF